MGKIQDGDITYDDSYTDGTQVREGYSGLSNFPAASNVPEGVVLVDQANNEFYQNRGGSWYPIDRNYFGTGEDGVWDGENIDPTTESHYEEITVESGQTLSFTQRYNGVAVVRVQEDLVVNGTVNVSGLGPDGGQGGQDSSATGDNGNNLIYDNSTISGTRGQGGSKDSFQVGGNGGSPVSNPSSPDNSDPNNTYTFIAPGAGGGGGQAADTIDGDGFEYEQYGGAGGGGGASRDNSGTQGEDATSSQSSFGDPDNNPAYNGGAGGGAVLFIVGGDIILEGTLNCSGEDGSPDGDGIWGGGGGGGGAGMMWLLHRKSLTDNASKNTSGGAGGSTGYADSGDGGPGGNGQIIIESV